MLNNSILRYKKDIHSDVLGEDCINLLSKNFYIPDEFTYQLVKITDSMTARPDLLSYYLYSDDGYGDLLCKLNGIQNPFELNEGDMLICPSPSDLFKFLADDDFSEEESGSRPKAKRKSQKRRPNEATEGDARFTVDSTRRIVVY